MSSTNKKLALACIVLILSGYLLAIAPSLNKVPLDFRSFYYAGKAYSVGANIYNHKNLNFIAQQSGDRGYVYPYLYPPALAFYLSPLSNLEKEKAGSVWRFLTAACIALLVVMSTYVCITLFHTPDKKILLIYGGSIALMTTLPFYNNLKMGQINCFVLILVLLAVIQASVYKRQFVAGLIIAPAVLIKLTPIGFLVYFILQKQYKVIYGLLIGALIIIVPTLIADNGLQNWQAFFYFSSTTGYGKTIPGLFPAASLPNFSVAGWAARLATQLSSVNIITTAILGTLGLILCIRHYQLRRTSKGILLLLPYLILMTIGAPVSYLHHVVFIYPGILISSVTLLQSKHSLRIPLLIGLLTLTLIASIDFPLYYKRMGIDAPLFQSLNLYALLGLFFIGLAVARVSKTQVK